MSLKQPNINVRQFLSENIRPYDGDESFLVGPTEKTQKLWDICKKLLQEEQKKGGVYGIDINTPSTITSHKAGYIQEDLELIYGLQTDKPLVRAIKPLGGIRLVMQAVEENGYQLPQEIVDIFTKYRKTHNDGVFDVYTEMMRKLRKTHVLTGLPDAYARGRIIGDYRRIALYGIDALIEAKEYDKSNLEEEMTDDILRLREEISEQIKALKEIKIMASEYGFDISKPATNSKEAIQWTYFAYLSALKEQDGAAMSLGNVSSFFDIYLEKDLEDKKITEEEAQELIDQFVIKLRLVRHLRPDAYNQLFSGDPVWLTEAIGGTFTDGRHKVTKTSYRFLQTLYNLGPSPEPNLTVLWSKHLPENFQKFCTKVSIDTSSIQYENDDLMQTVGGYDDYGISCCVSRLEMGQQMQFFGARCNLAKALLLAINDGKDEITGIQLITDMKKIDMENLNYEEVKENFDKAIAFLAKEYVKTMNAIHYIHDKYYYERAQMAFLDSQPKRVMGFGLAGLSVVCDSLSAIKFAKIKAIRNEQGLTTDFEIDGDFPKFGNDDDRVDLIAKKVVDDFYKELCKYKIYRDAEPTISILTITSNVVYGKNTGATPDGRKAGVAFAPGANPMHGRDTNGAIASMNSVAKIDYKSAKDGISYTFSIIPQTLGSSPIIQRDNLIDLINGYFSHNAQHINVNVLNRDILKDAMQNPEKYPSLTIRVSGYAVLFNKLTKEQQKEVISRTFFEKI